MANFLQKLFTKHPHEVGETYWEHTAFALKMGVSMLAMGIVVCIHALFPFLFIRTSSTIAAKLCRELSSRKNCSDTHD